MQSTSVVPVQQMYENAITVSPPKPEDNNLLNDYNYQDDLFGYSNDGYQNYAAYPCEPNPNDSYAQRPPDFNYNKNPNPGYNYEPWNDNYAQFPPPQQHNNFEPQGPPMMNQQQFIRPPGGFQHPPPNDFGRPPQPYDNHNYREYY